MLEEMHADDTSNAGTSKENERGSFGQQLSPHKKAMGKDRVDDKPPKMFKFAANVEVDDDGAEADDEHQTPVYQNRGGSLPPEVHHGSNCWPRPEEIRPPPWE